MSIFDTDSKLTIILNTIGNLIVLNILTLICSIPIVTIGASITALYSMTMKIARKEEGKIIQGYFRDFRENFKKSTIVWLIGGGLILFMSFDIWLLSRYEGSLFQGYRIVLFVLILLTAMILMHVFGLLARFENTIKNTVKNAVILTVGRFFVSILMLFVVCIPVVLLFFSMRFISVDILIGISGPGYLVGYYFSKIFAAYEEES